MVPRGGIEPPTRGFSIQFGNNIKLETIAYFIEFSYGNHLFLKNFLILDKSALNFCPTNYSFGSSFVHILFDGTEVVQKQASGNA
ncbi:hypothetical protein CSC82_01355 [Rhodobacteraceae bacterium 4F10]|nr:hypothetical protein CSC82_01355 [Rhodobacteraceae bacterium 4F10]